MANSRKRAKRRRGVLLSPEGWERLQAAQLASELDQNEGEPYTIEQLAELTRLSTNTLGRLRSGETPVDRQTLKIYFETFGLTLTPADYASRASATTQVNVSATVATASDTTVADSDSSDIDPVATVTPVPNSPTPPEAPSSLPPLARPQNQQDWGEAIDVSVFHGRTTELATLEQWIEQDRCRLIGIFGMGGIGKTALSVKLAEQIQSQFEFIIWRSLRNAPTLDVLLSELVPFLSHQQVTEPTRRSLLDCLRQARCLLIFDNLETILQAGSQAGYCRPGYEDYGDLLRVVGEASHQSCVVLTSREKPAEVAMFEGVEAAVRSLPLSGSFEIALAMVEAQGLAGTLAQKQTLCEHYGCSPLALKIVASSIKDLFDRDIAQFLAEEVSVFYGVRRLLDQQFERLSELEQSIMYWLAINREWTTLSELATDIVPQVSRTKILVALESLSWRSLLEKQASQYTQQPVVMEYVSDRLTDQVFQELSRPEDLLPTCLFNRHALLKTTVKDYVRESQIRLILQPIIHQLQTTFGLSPVLEQQLQRSLTTLRTLHSPGYGSGNLINLLHCLGVDLTGYDFSKLSIWQAYLQNVDLHQVNFENANLVRCAFTQTFESLIALAFSPDGELLATGDMDGEPRLWQVADGQPIQTFERHKEAIWSIAWSPNGRTLATGSEDRTVKLWDIQSGACLRTLKSPLTIRAIDWSPDGQSLASGGDDNYVRLWQVATGECANALAGHTGWVYAVAFSPNTSENSNPIVASGSFDQTIRLWDIVTHQCVKTLQGHTGGIWSVTWSPDSQRLASSGEDAQIRVWDIASGQCLMTLAGHKSLVFSVAWSPDGNTLASASYDQTIRLWDAVSGQCLTTLRQGNNMVWSAVWHPLSNLFATGSHDRTIKLWELQSRACRRTLQGYTNRIWDVVWHPDGQTLASGSNDCTIRVWHPSSGQCLQTLRGHTSWIIGLDWSPDGQTLVSGSDDLTVRLWQASTGKCIQILEDHSSWVWSVAWSPDGQRLASSSGDQTVRIWDVASGQCLLCLEGHQNWVWTVAWRPDGQVLASGCDDQKIRLWDSQEGTCLQVLEGHRNFVRTIAWQPVCLTSPTATGRLLASGSDDLEVRLWDTDTGACVNTLKGHTDQIKKVAWHPDGVLLASAAADFTVRVWNTVSSECVNVLQGHQGTVWSVAWSPDGQTLASSSTDETIRLWDVDKGECRQILRSARPYEGLNITGVTGITAAQKATLMTLGAIGG
ncbi:MAG: NB-ARC domain-containing protein [Cyanobacteria bacterium J06639_14]